MYYWLNLIVLLYIILIFIAWFYKIRSFWLAFIIIIINVIIIFIGWFLTSIKNTLTYHNNINKEQDCIISYHNNNIKKEAGIFYGSCVDYWHLLHILLYILIGILYPNNYIIIILTSIIWEIIEHFIFKYIMKICNDKICGRIEDIFLNIFGYLLGHLFY